MNLFTVIDDAHGIIRIQRGVWKQVALYRRGSRVYIPVSGGYAEIRVKQDDGSHTTTAPKVKLIEHDLENVYYEKDCGECLRVPTKQAGKKAA